MVVDNMPESKDFGESAEAVSKSQRRRDALAQKALAARLIELGRADLARLPLDDELRAAIAEARRIHARIARKRQLQYVAKLLRNGDSEAILAGLQAIEGDARQLTARHHRAEAWRERLLADGDAAVGELMRTRPGTDAQVLRQLLRKARQEAAQEKPLAAARALFRMLREMDESEPLPP
jgi:ribosome-associated protein